MIMMLMFLLLTITGSKHLTMRLIYIMTYLNNLKSISFTSAVMCSNNACSRIVINFYYPGRAGGGGGVGKSAPSASQHHIK